MPYPHYRPRRLRQKGAFRKIIRETTLSPSNFILPLFVRNGKNVKNPITSMPGQYQLSVDNLIKTAKTAYNLGICCVMLFGIPEKKDPLGKSAYAKNGIVQKAVKELKETIPELAVITDVCLCQYTDHGHCGIVSKGIIVNDDTCTLLAEIALSHADAGADMIAPSDMMDGRIAIIRKVLDENGFIDIPIMSYAAKYYSACYGPFRVAADSAPKFGDRKTYQMDPANTLEAVREANLDMQEGADIIMVKPALLYLDIIRRIREEIDLPVAAYNVSGEYAMIKAAAKMGWLDEEKMMIETLTSIKRAGADIILTYFAIEAAKKIKS